MSEGGPTLPGMGSLSPTAGVVAAGHVWTTPPPVTVARFWAKVTRTPGCWWWSGALSHPDGYGRISWTQDGQRRSLSAHRFALLVDAGHLVHDTFGEHGCNETLCVRVDPAHLHAGSQRTNLAYAVALGRHRGSRPGNGDPRGRYGRAHAIREVLRDGYDPVRLAAAREHAAAPTLPLFALDELAGAAGGEVSEQTGLVGHDE